MAAISALSCLLAAAPPASAAPAAGCPGNTHAVYSGHNLGCEMDGQHHSGWVTWSGTNGRQTLAVVGVGYVTYYAPCNGCQWLPLDRGQASPSGGGIFFSLDFWDTQGVPLNGHYYVLGTDGHTRWCINFDSQHDYPTSGWYYEGCRTD
ncbi:hypothetical protein [Amycolatopsis sp. NPDC054798]